MEIEIDLNIALTPELAQRVQQGLVTGLELVSFKTGGKFSLRPAEAVDATLTIDQAIKNYLESIKPVGSMLERLGGELRVGVFFSADEAAAFSVELSNATVQMLSVYQLSIDVTCYPCS